MIRVVRVLSQGTGKAKVFLCKRIDSEELLVVKQLPASLVGSSSRGHQDLDFQHEYRVAMLLRENPHPHIVRMESVNHKVDCANAMAIEFCPGGDLFTRLLEQADQRFSEEDALRYFRQIVSGVRHLHSLGIAHRDISLENILLDDQNQAKIGDFGLSASSSILSRGSVGKPQYIAPEVTDGKAPYDPVAADVWSLGIVLFVLLTGSPLFQVTSPSDPAWRMLQRFGVGGILSNWKISDRISGRTIDLLSMMLRVNPTERVRLDIAVVTHM